MFLLTCNFNQLFLIKWIFSIDPGNLKENASMTMIGFMVYFSNRLITFLNYLDWHAYARSVVVFLSKEIHFLPPDDIEKSPKTLSPNIEESHLTNSKKGLNYSQKLE